MKGKIIGCLSLFALTAMLLTAFDLAADAKAIYEGTIRLHVLANSDSEEDQALKLKVRDALLCEMDDLLTSGDADDAADAAEMLGEALDGFTRIAEEIVAEEGFDYPVTLSLTEEYYETRAYEGFSLPAGEYTSLQVEIGEAQGQNWWCVLFPPLCTSVASAEETLVETGFTKRQVRLLTDNESTQYKLKFKTVEWFGELKHMIKGLFE